VNFSPVIPIKAAAQESVLIQIIDENVRPFAGWVLIAVNLNRLHLLTATLQQRMEQQALKTQKLYIQHVIGKMDFGKNWHMSCYFIPRTVEC
jgi:hypothetical protein